MSNDILQEFVMGDYLSFKHQDTISGVYIGVRKEDDPFGKEGETRLVYLLEVKGEKKQLASKSKRLANAMMDAQVKEGDSITIKRGGGGFDTYYSVEVEK